MTLNYRPSLNRMKPYIPGRSIESVAEDLGIKDIIKMASNENALGCPLSMKEMSAAFDSISHYANKESEVPLLKKLAYKHDIELNQVILGNGSDEVIQMVATAFLNDGEEVITSEHTFSQYSFITHLMNATLITVPMREYAYDLNGIETAVTKKTRLICIANPNNPTGTIIKNDRLKQFMNKVPKDVIVLLDEAYCDYNSDNDYPDSMALIAKYPNLLVTRTFSKIYGLAGLRIGYGIGQTELVQTLYKVKPPFNMNRFALIAAELVLDKIDHIEQSLNMNVEGKDYLYKELKEMGIQCLPSEANFICMFFECPGKLVFEALLRKGIIVRSLESFGIENAIRVTIGTKLQNQRFIQALKDCCSELS